MAVSIHRWVTGSLIAGGLILSSQGSEAQIQAKRPDLDFKGRFLLAASDTDMLPSGYIDQRLGPAAGPDQLSVIQLNQPSGKITTTAIDVSNSVIGPPSSIALTPDGRYAVVIETRGQRPANRPEALLSDLPTGRRITVVNLSDLSHPKVIQVSNGFDDPSSVSINAEGTLVAIVYKHAGKAKHPLLALYRLQQGKLQEAMIPEIPGPEAGDALVSAEFHPKRNVLGLVYAQHPRLSLVQVTVNENQVTLTPWGNPSIWTSGHSWCGSLRMVDSPSSMPCC